MGRKTKYCMNYPKGKHLRDIKSPSRCYCSDCYKECEDRIKRIQSEGGALVGLRAARVFAGGSFGYESRQSEKETNLLAFFHYVMPHIPKEKASEYAKEISKNGVYEHESHNGYKKVKKW